MNSNQTSVVWGNDEYGSSLVSKKSNGADIYVISDLHLGSGLNANSNYEGTENFFADDSFVRFLNYLQSKTCAGGATLVINGDVIDFIRILNIPVSTSEFETWQRILKVTGIDKSTAELRDSIVNRERKYGLKTNHYKSVWKLHVCINGHLQFFERLAQWISDGNELIIVKGNHDLEWYWKEVRRYLQYWLAENIAQKQNLDTNEVLAKKVIPQTLFIDDRLVIDNKIHIEHGHRFENMTNVKGGPLIPNGEELNLPFGSFFNRYLINRIELSYPYLDNVKPTQNILLVLFRERFPLAIKILFRYLKLMWLLVQKKVFWETLKYLFTFLLVIVLPIAITVYSIWINRPPKPSNPDAPFIVKQIVSLAKNLGFLFLSYLIARVMVMVQLKSPASFIGYAQEIFDHNKELEIVTFGHTHNPEQLTDMDGRYFNTGTWTPVFESSSSEVRMDKTFTFLQINRNASGSYNAQHLLRWNDDALRVDPMNLNEKK